MKRNILIKGCKSSDKHLWVSFVENGEEVVQGLFEESEIGRYSSAWLGEKYPWNKFVNLVQARYLIE